MLANNHKTHKKNYYKDYYYRFTNNHENIKIIQIIPDQREIQIQSHTNRIREENI